ncbi:MULTISPECIES: hypothetical protein [Streptosporangium]|uniref:Secreted protein n=1 Tax=Streptosporangium brasiliense TaxID=47480 RepID=A0ABT9RBP7_9ACTN|nr:hypothetical protein [Streptosporangium brasiliense]MDP9866688.1 hypothetical protein [Streptosporangium brasiliense]
MRISSRRPGAACAVLLSGILAAAPGTVSGALPGTVSGATSRAAAPSRCESDTARAVASQLERAPDGRFVPPDALSYGDGAEVITFRPPSCGAARRGAERDCDEDGVLDNAVCLYDRRAFEGSRQAVKVTGPIKLNGTGIIMSIKNDRPFVFLVRRSPDERGSCFPPGRGYGNTDPVGAWRWVNAHPTLRDCRDL